MARAVIFVNLLSVVHSDFSFVAIGDWGGETDQEPVTKSQKETAAAMMHKAKETGADFALMMGDNYYHHGINSPSDVSARFAQTFEEVYPALLPGKAFYAIAGNHDYGEGRLSNISAQLAYSNISPHWNFPSLWYSLSRSFTAGGHDRQLKLILIDTVVLCGNGAANVNFIDTQLEFLGQKADPTRPGHLREVLAERQWDWLEHELQAGSDVDYLWVSGHYPIWSAGHDGSQQCLIDRLFPLLRAYGAQYISGHDHNLEHIVHDDTSMFVVGAGKECCYTPRNFHTVPQGAMRFMLAGHHGQQSQPHLTEPVYGGFATLHFGAEHATVTFHTHAGEVIYTAPGIPRRSAIFKFVMPVALWLTGSIAGRPGQMDVGLPVFCISFGAAIAVFARYCRKRPCFEKYRLLEPVAEPTALIRSA